jgi:PAS domain S-box-containing protein
MLRPPNGFAQKERPKQMPSRNYKLKPGGVAGARPAKMAAEESSGSTASANIRATGRVLQSARAKSPEIPRQEIAHARDYDEAVLRTMRTPFLVLRDDLRVDRANEAFYNSFKVSPADVEGRVVFELGDGAWNLPALHELLEEILLRDGCCNDFELVSEFPRIGRRTVLLNARRLERENAGALILLSIEDATERLKRCAVMERSEIRYRRLFEAAQDGILILDPVTRKITDANPFIAQLLGYSRGQLFGKELWEIGLLKDEQASQDAFRELQERGFICYEDLPLETKDGTKREVEFVSNLYKENGHTVIQCNIRDITERKQVEQKLRRSQQELADFIENASVAMHWVGPDGMILWANRTELEMLGYAREEYVGNHISEFHADGPVIEDILWRLSNHETLHNYEARLRCKDGSIRQVLISSNVLWEDNKFIHTRCFTQDITERKRVEEALRESEERFHRMADNIAPLAWMADAAGRIFWYNKRWFDYTGTTLEEARGWGWKKVIHSDHVKRVVARVQQSLDTGELWEDTFLLRGKDGAYRWFLSRAFPIRSSDGKISRWFGTNMDIQELRETQEALKKTQEQLREHAADLERTVAERTASLRETVGELEAFSHSIAHDMRSPLRSMGGYSEIVLREYAGKLDATGVEFLERIVRSSRRLDELIRDTLNYSKVLGGVIVNKPVDLDRLLRDILQTYPDCQLPKAEIQIEGTIPMVLGNEAFLTQCISNLLSNAVKFVAPGTCACVRIRAEHYDSQVRLCFQDNGIGIAPENRARIFRMFERLYPATEYEGTGIGLTIARKAAGRMGAEIGFESEPGQGSTFWIQLQSA